MIVSHWPQSFRKLYGGQWPTCYVAFDLETTGYDVNKDVITEWGHVIVQDCEVVDKLSLVIDWTNHPVVPDHWLKSRLAAVKSGMARAGKTCHMSYELMRKKGLKPDKALRFIHEFLTTLQKSETIFVSHGGYSFDEKMIVGNFAGFQIDDDFSFGDNNMIDTEGVEKASQDVTNPKVHVRPGDTLRSYFHRIKYTRLGGVKSNLDDHCFRKYGFATDHGIDPGQMHSAATDSYCCHLLMEAFRKQISDVPPGQVILHPDDPQLGYPSRPKAPKPTPQSTPLPTPAGKVRRHKQRNRF